MSIAVLGLHELRCEVWMPVAAEKLVQPMPHWPGTGLKHVSCCDRAADERPVSCPCTVLWQQTGTAMLQPLTAGNAAAA